MSGFTPERRKGEVVARSSQPALNLVQDKQSVIPARQSCRRAQKFRVQLEDAAFPLDGFQQNCPRMLVDPGPQVGHIIEADKLHSGQQGAEWQAVLLEPGGRQRPHRASVERVIQRHQVKLVSRLGAMGPGQF